jgi:hypothetical protein
MLRLLEQLLQLLDGGFEQVAVAEDAHLVGHDVLHAGISAAAFSLPSQRWRRVRRWLSPRIPARGRWKPAGRRGGFQKSAISPTIMPATTVSATELPPSRLKPCRSQQAASPQANRPRSLAVGVGADAAHRVMLGRAHRDQSRAGSMPRKCWQISFTSRSLPSMWAAPSRVMSSHRCSPKRPDALAGADVLFHAARHHVAGGELLLLRLVVGHEAVAGGVAQQAAVAPAALGDQDAGREDGGRVELHRLHVAQRPRRSPARWRRRCPR